jgi:glycine/D-amino acid oxidase-like deaminating enzyme
MNNSFWWHELPNWQPRAAIEQDLDLDVAIIGAGYTGLWSAFYLKQLKPELNVAIFEAEHVGFGASGRNGGWVSALWPVQLSEIAKLHGAEVAHNFQVSLHALIDELEQTLIKYSIAADFQKSGTMNFARSQPQLTRLQRELTAYRKFGFGDADYQLVSNLATLPNATNLRGALVSPHCASIHPAKLVRGLAEQVESMGVTIYENSKVTKLSPREINVNNRKVKAPQIVVAIEGYRHQLLPRTTAPIHSLMFITDLIPAALLDELRIPAGVTFNDARNLVIYGQRTSANQIAFGGRGAPYQMGSKTGIKAEMHQGAFKYLQSALIEMFPDLQPYCINPSYTWGGPIGVSRDWKPSVSYSPVTGIATAGNYVGDGVAASFLAGQTIADLLTSRTSAITNLPWVDHSSKRWEVEPIRYLLINLARVAINSADRVEQSLNRETVISKILWRLLKG